MLIKLATKITKLLEKCEKYKTQILALIEKLELLIDVTEGQLIKAKAVIKEAKEKINSFNKQ